jgi:hypothetical protein
MRYGTQKERLKSNRASGKIGAETGPNEGGPPAGAYPNGEDE